MAVEAIQQVTELERTVKQEKELRQPKASSASWRPSAPPGAQVEESRQNAEAETGR